VSGPTASGDQTQEKGNKTMEKPSRGNQIPQPDSPKILLVDDRAENILVLESLLEQPGLVIHSARSGNEALAMMLDHEYALVLLDVQMPEMDGYELAEIMRNRARTMHVPIIFVTAIAKDQQHIFKGYDKGAVDYLFKPLEEHLIKSKVKVFLDLYEEKREIERINKKLGQTMAELQTANHQILAQQHAVIEEERLKLLLQMAGATVQEMNHPLRTILSGIVQMKEHSGDKAKLLRDLAYVQEAGKAMEAILERIQIMQSGSVPAASNGGARTPVRVLHVEDCVDYQSLTKRMLPAGDGFDLTAVATLNDALELLGNSPYDLILLDYDLPDGSAFGLLEKMPPQNNQVPVIVLTGYGDEVLASRLIRQGVADYLPKGDVSRASLHLSIEKALEKSRLKMELNQALRQLGEQATHDPLSGLFNRRFFMETLQWEVTQSARYQRPLSLCILDIDNFKTINDRWGHPAGDLVIAEIAHLTKKTLRTSDCSARYGGEEFSLIMPETTAPVAFGVCERLRGMVENHQFAYHQDSFQVTISVGLADYPPSAIATCEEFIARADTALYLAKRSGKNKTVIA
jgi:two-component system, cell cycle response regulator